MSVRTELAKSVAFRKKRLSGHLRRRLNLHGDLSEIAFYRQTKEDNLAAKDVYQEGEFWGDINEEFTDLLWAGSLTNVRNEYFNRRFAGPDPCSRQVWRALLWVYYQYLLELDEDGFLESASEPPEGGAADQELIDGRPVSLDFLQSVEEVYRIREAWALARRPGVPKLIVELGAGYGRLAYVFRKMLPECTYVIIDLPEALTCSSSWLQKVLPGEVVPYEASRAVKTFSYEDLLTNKVWTLGAHQIEQIASGAVEVFINIYSFAEMPKKAIDNYFMQISRITRGVFYSKQRKLERNVADGVEMTADLYPVHPSWQLLFNRTTKLYENFFEVAYSIQASGELPS